MSTVGINFGSATSGTGFDVTTTVASIMANLRLPETAWATQTTALQAQDAALSTIGTDLSGLSTALETLTSFDGSFSQKDGAVSDPSVAELTNATSTAAAGTHTLTVQQLATTSTQHSSTVATGATLTGNFTFTVGTGTAQTITLDSTDNTLTGLASAINGLNAGVTANVITDSSGSRLSLISSSSGAANEISTSGSSLTDSSGNSVSFTETQAGVDAAYTLDGISLTSSSNAISTALKGVTFQLTGTSSSGVTLQIANDTSSISSDLSTFVSAYNALATALSAQEGNDSTGTPEPLYGDQTLSLLQSQISTAFAFATSNKGATSNLAQIGIAVGTTGQLTLDTGALATALSSNFNGVAGFFQNAGDFGQNLTTTLNGLGTMGDGALALRTTQNTSEEKTLADNKTSLELRLTAYQANLTAELNTANQVLQAIPQQLNETNEIYAAITGYGNNSNG